MVFFGLDEASRPNDPRPWSGGRWPCRPGLGKGMNGNRMVSSVIPLLFIPLLIQREDGGIAWAFHPLTPRRIRHGLQFPLYYQCRF